MGNQNIRYYYNRLNIAERLIVINVAVFILSGLLKILFGFSGDSIIGWFELPKDFFHFLTQPWSIVTYSFFHSGLGHIFWNMLMLYYAGRIFMNLFDNRRFLNVYFLGVILGGMIFLLSYNIFPALLGINTSLIGASAGVTAVLIFVCSYLPNQEVRVIFFNVKLWHIGVFVVLLDLIQISMGGNVGGRLAHLGGAALGYFYARQLINGNDIGSGFAKFLDAIANLFKRSERKAPLKTVYRKENRGGASTENYDKESRQRKIDAILDKISKSGYESLSKAEKDFLFKAGKE
ncbi:MULTISPECIES: rhomboid family intramembrane serine protease [Arenibacter]|uniref:rhomboid family intramembrane serine protease n=1 Tax=Arenibacter TaxID=178469 RepID=UPI001C06E359|nr:MULTISPECIES: rhomboid family intramembrane serine protease [Arenibacter]MBU2903700.1 rhomboid family intramembrane serine protease [Arenibacter algicola]MCK0133979.1 rhomboid family intramembrane serine protease [Arenibacter sp. S6351L]|tara:strand:+ start:475 stop:1347 length:873 start_codon:yes stop_codon:yes gene_type:complete